MLLNDNNLFEFGDFQINLSERTLWHHGTLVPLTPKAIETLCVLVENHGRLVTKDELMEKVWADCFVEERNLTQNIFTLRKILGGDGGGKKIIETVPRRGYRFVAQLEPVVAETLAVSHTRQMRVTAEGFVSKKELTEAVREITRSLVGGNSLPADEPKQIETRRKTFFAPPFSSIAVTMLVLPLLVFGALVWAWQNEYLNFRNAAVANNAAPRPLLEFERLTHSGKAFTPTVSPDKQFIAYVLVEKGQYSIRLLNIASGSKTAVVAPSEREIGQIQFSPDGNYLFYRQEEGTGKSGVAYKIPIFGGTPRLIAPGVNSSAALSPDGEWLAFIRFRPDIDGQQLIVCRSRDGSEQRVVATRTGNESFRIWGHKPTFSPDGKKVFVGLLSVPTPEKSDARGEDFGLMNIETGSFEPLKTPAWNKFIQAEWMPGGESILFLAREKANETYQIWRVAYPSGEGSRLTNDSHDYRYLNIAPDGEFILTTQERTYFNLWLIATRDPNETRQLTFSSELIHGHGGIAWTPDGREIVHTLVENNVDTNLWRINVETLEKRQITFDRERVNLYPNVMPDGKSIIFTSNRENGMHVRQMNLDGTNPRRITDGVGELASTVTADGKWLIYASPAGVPESLWKKSLTGDEAPVKLLSGAAGSNSISPDGKYLIVCYKIAGEDGRLDFKYGLMPFEPTEQPADLGFNPSFGAIAWKKDNSGFYYVKDLGINLNNIWFYDLKTRAHRQITDFDDRMSSLSLSPDGNTLATARGETISNVFKISGF